VREGRGKEGEGREEKRGEERRGGKVGERGSSSFA